MYKFFGYIFLSFFITGCVNYSETPGNSQESLPRELTASEEELVVAEQSFSYEMFKSIVEEDDETDNIIVSPLSVSLALGVILNGAFGETQDEIQQTLHLGDWEDGDLQTLNDSYKGLIELLLNLDPNIDLKIANALWYRDDLAVREEFIVTAEDYFSTEVRSLDTRDREASDIVNDWVESRTEGNIEHVMRSVPRFMTLYLISAAYFRGDWLFEFDPELTRRDSFFLENGSGVLVDIMELQTELATYESDEVVMLDLPMGNDQFKMTLLMPGNPQRSIHEFVKETLTAENMSNWINGQTREEIRIRLPVFELEYVIDLEDVLDDMGMDEIFEHSSDFYYISDGEGVYLNEFRHKARITVDEEGVEETQPPSVDSDRVIHLNRPFVFVVREHESGAVIFMGKVMNPSR